MTIFKKSKFNMRISLLLFLLLLLAYFPALQAGFIWDDDDYVIHNGLLRTLDGLWRIWASTETPQYYPLVFTTFWVEYQLWGLHPMGYHVTNLLLHGANAVLVGIVLQRLQVRGAWWVAFLFALHPVHVESVAWVTERKNVLSGLFYLAALLNYLRYDESPSWQRYVSTLVLFFFALLSKTVTSTLPAVLILVLYYRHHRVDWSKVIRLIPFFGLAVAMGLLTVWWERTHVGATGVDFDFQWWQRTLIASKALLFYAQKLLVPYPLIFNYPRWDLELNSFVDLWPIGAVACIMFAVLWMWHRQYRGGVVTLLFYAGTLFPALGFFNVYPFRYSFVADHFQYLASLGILILVAEIGIRLAERFQQLRLFQGIGVAVLLLFSVLTWQQTHAYHDLESLWQDTLRKNPQSWMAYNNLAGIYFEQRKFDQSLDYLNKALSLNPNLPEAYTGRGMIYSEANQFDRALAEFNHALQLKPYFVGSSIQRGRTYLKMQEYHRAIADFDVALQAVHVPEVYRYRGFAYARIGQWEAAFQDWEAAIRQFPEYADVYEDRGTLYLQRGNLEPALADLSKAISLGSLSMQAYYNRGITHAQMKQLDAAIADFTKALELEPNAAFVYIGRGQSYWQQRLAPEACQDWKQACDLGECVSQLQSPTCLELLR